MKSRLLTLLVLAAAGWGLWHWALAADQREVPTVQEGLMYPHLDPAAIVFIHMTLDFGYDLELEREPSGPWRITAPTDELARNNLVEQWLDNVAQATVRPLELSGEPVPASMLGLEPPLHQFTLRDVEGNSSTVFLGEIEPLDRYVYARHKGSDEIGLVTRNVLSFTGYHGEEWVDPDLLRGLAGRVDRLKVIRPQGVLLDAERRGNDWSLVEPAGVLPDSEHIDSLLRSLQFARVERVLASRPSPTELRNLGFPTDEQVAAGDYGQATYIELGAAGERPVWALLGAGWEQSADLAPARRGGATKIVGVPAATFNMLLNEPGFFRQHALLPPVRERARSLRVEQGSGDDQQVLLDVAVDKQGNWVFRGPERLVGVPVENRPILGHTALLDLLGRIDRMQAVAFGDTPTGAPLARVVIGWQLAGAQRQDTVSIYAPLTDGPFAGLVPVVTSERPRETLLMPRAILELLEPRTADLLRGLAPLQVDTDRFAELLIHHGEHADPLRLWRDEAGRWQGDDEWGRIYGLTHDLLNGFHGYGWRPAAPSRSYPAEVVFRDADGAVLARLSLRPTAADEPPEAYGKPVVMAAIDSVPGFELQVPKLWLERLDALDEPQLREP